MKIPELVKVGGHWIKVVYRTYEKDAYGNAGSSRSVANLIVLDGNMSSSKQESVLFHEVIHEIAWQCGLETS